jgi:hypothetical protein
MGGDIDNPDPPDDLLPPTPVGICNHNLADVLPASTIAALAEAGFERPDVSTAHGLRTLVETQEEVISQQRADIAQLKAQLAAMTKEIDAERMEWGAEFMGMEEMWSVKDELNIPNYGTDAMMLRAIWTQLAAVTASVEAMLAGIDAARDGIVPMVVMNERPLVNYWLDHIRDAGEALK